MLKLVATNGLIIQYAGQDIRNNDKVILKAVCQ